MDKRALQPATSDFRLYLQLEYSARRKVNSGYSLRGFARTLGVSPSALSGMFSGKRPVSDKMRERLGLRLGLTPKDLTQFKKHRHGNCKNQMRALESEQAFAQISADVFQVISEPHHYALLELIKTRDFNWNSKWIAKRLKLSLVEVQAVVERLENVGLLERNAKGVLEDSTNGFSTDIREGLSLEAQRRYQQASLRNASVAIDEVSHFLRDNTSITFAVNKKSIEKARSLIKTFRRKLCRELESDPDLDEVYQLTIAFTPISDITEDSK